MVFKAVFSKANMQPRINRVLNTLFRLCPAVFLVVILHSLIRSPTKSKLNRDPAASPIIDLTRIETRDGTKNLVETLSTDEFEFCAVQPPGLYCHPRLGNYRLFCPEQESSNLTQVVRPTMIPCEEHHFCRAHWKLHFQADLEKSNAASFPQCVSENDIDLDAYCEDKLFDYRTSDMFSSSSTSVDEWTLQKTKDFITYLNDDQLHISFMTQGCNPFHAQRKEILYCALVETNCEDVTYEVYNVHTKEVVKKTACVPKKYIRQMIEACPSMETCRDYHQDNNHSMRSTKCFPPMEAVCRDRFWSIYSQDPYEQLPELVRNVQNNAEQDTKKTSTSLRFEFCNPFNNRDRIVCNLDLVLFQRPSFAKDEKFASLKELFQLEKQYATAIRSVDIAHNPCPKEAVRITDLAAQIKEDSEDSTLIEPDPWQSITGPLCKQLSRRYHRCMPFPTFDPPGTIPTSNQDVTFQPAQLVPENYAGFCLGKPGPGQYCVAGSPESVVLCPQGRLLRCPRSHPKNPASWDDLNNDMYRCVQRYGVIPKTAKEPIEYTNQNYIIAQPDPMRDKQVVDIAGQPVEYGYWAQCAKLNVSALPNPETGTTENSE